MRWDAFLFLIVVIIVKIINRIFPPELADRINIAGILVDKWLEELIPHQSEFWTSQSSLQPIMMNDEDSPDNCHVNGKVKGLYQDSMMTSFKTGAVMDLIEHLYVAENQINQRGGWTLDRRWWS